MAREPRPARSGPGASRGRRPDGSGHRRLPLVAVEASNLLSGTANGITSVVLPWLVLERTGSPAAAGLVAAATALPLLLSSVVAGTVIDRVGRRRASVVSDVLSTVSVAAIPLLALASELSLSSLVALAVLGAAFDPAGATAREAMLPEAAGAAGVRLERANGLHEAVFGLAFIVGPGLAGVLIGVIGAEDALWATAAAFVASALVVALVRIPGGGRPEPVPRERRTSFLADTREGFAFVRRDRLLLAVTVLGTVLAGTYLPIEGVLLPVYFQEQGTPERLGLLLLAMSVGWVAGIALYGALGDRLPRRATFVTALVGTALALVPMAFLPPYPVLLAAGALSGFLYGPVNPMINLVLQVRTPERMRGRVIGVVTSAAYAAGPLGYLATGPLVEWLGLRPAFALVVGAVLLSCLAALVLPGIEDLDRLEGHGGADRTPADDAGTGHGGRSLPFGPAPHRLPDTGPATGPATGPGRAPDRH